VVKICRVIQIKSNELV